ncbi:MAG: hypothetical protein WC959_11110 [Kiritimatiellales bacterium]
MKQMIHFSLALVLLAGTAGFSAEIIHISNNFEDDMPRVLNTGRGWSVGKTIDVEIVNDPVSGDQKALLMKRNASGAVTYTSAGGSNRRLLLAENGKYEWSFSFYVDSSSPKTSGSSMFIFLDTGATTGVFASLLIRFDASRGWSAYAYDALNAPFTGFSSYRQLCKIDMDQWYDAKVLITIEKGKVGYDVTIGSNTHTVRPQTGGAAFAPGSNVRMGWSPQIDGTTMLFDNLQLKTISVP